MNVDVLRKYAEQGLTRKEIAQLMGLPLSTISNNCTKHGIVTKRPQRELCDNTKDIIRLRREGLGYVEISKRLGLTKANVISACKLAGLTGTMADPNPNKLTEKQAADYISRSGFDYVSGYTKGKADVIVRCRDCGRTFKRQFHIFRDVVNGTWTAGNECPLCRQDKQEKREREQEAEREERRIKAEHEAQEAAKRKAERLSRKVGNETTKRLATHVCKNCGVEFCQMVTGYNSEKYCSERCQIRWLNRHRSEKRYNTLMARRHDNNISLERLFNRDKGICYLCGGACDWSDGETKGSTFVAGNNYPSIDHVIAVAKGGTHTWDNIRLAHRICNTLKRDS